MDGNEQHLLTTNAVAHSAEDKGADDARNIACAVGAHREDQRHRGGLFREEDLMEDQSGTQRVKLEIHKFQGSAQPAGNGGFHQIGCGSLRLYLRHNGYL